MQQCGCFYAAGWLQGILNNTNDTGSVNSKNLIIYNSLYKKALLVHRLVDLY